MQNTTFFDATLRPHRSLSKTGFLIVMVLIGGGGFIIGLGFFMIGAWPVAGFCGLEVLLIYWAFRMNFKDAKRCERVILNRQTLEIQRVDPKGHMEAQKMDPTWLNVLMDDPPEHHSRLLLVRHGIKTEIGRFLQPEEKLEVASELRKALQQRAASPVETLPA